MKRRFLITLFLMLAIALPEIALACPVCYGDADSPVTDGANNAVIAMLGVVGFVQIGFASMFIAFWRRAKHLRERREKFQIIEGGRA